MQLANRLNNDDETCNAADGHYHIWFDALNTGFCYTILS
jgi:hypothetical protein